MNRLLFFAQNKPLFILVLVGILGGFIFLSVIFINLVTPQKQEQAPISTDPKVIYPKPPSQETIRQEKTYSAIKIGETTSEDIKKLPELKSEQVKGNLTEFSFKSARFNDNTVITENNIVVFKKIITIDPDTWQHPPLSSYLSAYGSSEAEFTGSNLYGPVFKTYVYPSKGLAFIGNPFPDELYEIQVFEPTTLEVYRSKWGTDINETPAREELDEGQLIGR